MSKWQALTNVSVPQREGGKLNGRADLVATGETVELPDAEAEAINNRNKTPVLRPARESGKVMPHISGMALWGPRGTPGPPAEARPDPPGSSQVHISQQQITDPALRTLARMPEFADPHGPGHQIPAAAMAAQVSGGGGIGANPDAQDIPPRAARG